MSEPRTVTEMRAALTPEHLRRMGVPKTVMSDFEIAAAIQRDKLYEPTGNVFSDTAYDRRGLLNVLGFLAALPRPDSEALRAALEDAARQFGYWSDKAGGVGTGGLSTLENIFDLLGWEDPHPLPDRRCDEPGCMEDGTMGWPTRPGGTGPNGGYRRTCFEHSKYGEQARAALTPEAEG
jgi:hypothetical protein